MEKVRDRLCGYIGEIDDYLFYDKKAMDKAIAYDEGMADGIEQKTHAVAKEMILDKIDIDTISKYTKLSIEEIEKIKNELENDAS